MLETVTKGFRAARNRLAGKQEITPELVDESLRDIRVSLLEADVAFDVVKSFVARVREKAVGSTVQTTITDKQGRKHKVSAGDHFIKVCHDELEALMGPVDTSLKFKPKGGVTTMMLVGLQGSGKTTTVGKLASYLEKKGRKPLLVAADIYRPAAVDQLQVLGERLGVPVFFQPDTLPPDLAVKGVEAARAQKCDVVLIDTAGRLAIDEQLMNELNLIKASVQPDDILLVCDAMIGQDAVRTAAEFDRRLALDGFILTKLDGDARGGAALSIKEVTGKPIKLLGMGEALDKLEEFRPDGLASRILGFGDIVGLMQDFEQVVDEKKAEEDAKKLLKGKFDMQDFLEQIRVIQKMGSLKDIFEKMPFFGGALPEGVNLDDRELKKIEAMISSMTREERTNPQVFVATTWEDFMATSGRQAKRRRADFNPGRVKRVSRGSGRSEQEVKELLQKFAQMRQMMVQLGASTGLMGKIPGFKQFSQMKKLANMDINALMAAGGGMPAGLGEGAGMPNMLAMPGVPTGHIPGLPKGYNPPGSKGVVGQVRASDKQ